MLSEPDTVVCRSMQVSNAGTVNWGQEEQADSRMGWVMTAGRDWITE